VAPNLMFAETGAPPDGRPRRRRGPGDHRGPDLRPGDAFLSPRPERTDSWSATLESKRRSSTRGSVILKELGDSAARSPPPRPSCRSLVGGRRRKVRPVVVAPLIPRRRGEGPPDSSYDRGVSEALQVHVGTPVQYLARAAFQVRSTNSTIRTRQHRGRRGSGGPSPRRRGASGATRRGGPSSRPPDGTTPTARAGWWRTSRGSPAPSGITSPGLKEAASSPGLPTMISRPGRGERAHPGRRSGAPGVPGPRDARGRPSGGAPSRRNIRLGATSRLVRPGLLEALRLVRRRGHRQDLRADQPADLDACRPTPPRRP